MSMSTSIVGFRPADDKWRAMKGVWDACLAVKLIPPQEVIDFFDGEHPGDTPGREIELGAAKHVWRDEFRDGFELDIEALPAGVRYIRFYNSW